MEKFKVKVKRIEYSIDEIEVEAESLEDAQDLALENAEDIIWGYETIYDVMYKVAE
jgi:hypothetical protein